MIRKLALLLVTLTLFLGCATLQSNDELIATSRNNCVCIISTDLNRRGTGFFIDSTHVVTCFHVIGDWQVVDPIKGQIRLILSKKIEVVLIDGETIEATLISIPTQKDFSPITDDFAILELIGKPKMALLGLSIYKGKEAPKIGSDVVFSGYPLNVPTMVTHKGNISCGVLTQGILNQEVCIQASINEGNSGGAVLNNSKQVIGIIEAREGKVSQEFQEKMKMIGDEGGGMVIAGINTMDMTKDLAGIVDEYISPGIGYAHLIQGVEKYLEINPSMAHSKY